MTSTVFLWGLGGAHAVAFLLLIGTVGYAQATIRKPEQDRPRLHRNLHLLLIVQTVIAGILMLLSVAHAGLESDTVFASRIFWGILTTLYAGAIVIYSRFLEKNHPDLMSPEEYMRLSIPLWAIFYISIIGCVAGALIHNRRKLVSVQPESIPAAA